MSNHLAAKEPVDKEEESESVKEKKLIDVEYRDWSSLPSELLNLILPYLSFDDTNRCWAVCKSWQSAVSTPWVPSPFRFLVFQSQWLMCYDGKRYKFYHPVSNFTYNFTYQMEFPELFDAVPRFSKDGWVLMSRGNHSIFFFNPFTNAKINLPDFPHIYFLKGISFSSVPTAADCIVFGFYSLSNDYLRILTICRGEEAWHDHTQIFDNNLSFYPPPCNPVFFNGMFYCLGVDRSLRVFNPKENGTWTVCALPEQPCGSPRQIFLMECDGELISVFVGFMGTWVSIFRLDNSKMVWREVEDLGDRMLFVSSTACLSARKVINGMENKIYFPRFHGKFGVFYSLATRRFQTFGKDYCRKNFCKTKEWLYCTWIVPNEDSHSREELLVKSKNWRN